ncbi:MAG: protein kinase [Anaerolineales bacterium]|nr:protein kinase [Anaerolineales bacterium]
MPFVVGESVGPYRITEQLGQGGMATVFKAYHAALDRYVALKVLHPAFMEDETFQARFTREARLVAKLEHVNIVPVYDFAEHEKRPYLVMKYIEGETLKAHLSKGPLSGSEIIRIVDSIGAALTYSHKQGVLHRDIKPSNVLITPDGQVYLSDFGLARIAQSGESTLSSDMIMGTPQYISPEQAMGAKDLDEGTDIYSFGVMLYEMVVGQVPFSADTPFSIIHDHIYTPLPMPRKINTNVPESVERVLLKALSKERADRFVDVSSMVQAFKDAWDASGVPIRGTTLTVPVPETDSEKRQPVPEKVEAPGEAVASEAETIVRDDIPSTKTDSTKKKKRSPWMIAAVSVLVLLCCLVAFIAIRRNNEDISISGVRVQDETPRVEVKETAKPEQPEGQPTRDLPPELSAAQQVAEETEDPQAFLALSLAYWEARMPVESYSALAKAGELAGQDLDFFVHAGNESAAHGSNLGAAGMYIQAGKILISQGDEIPIELMDSIHASLFWAAKDPMALEYLDRDDIGRIGKPLLLVTEARYQFFNGDPQEGHRLLNDALRLKPNYPMAVLLEGEAALTENRYEEAERIFTELGADLQSPPWIRDAAHQFLREIP